MEECQMLRSREAIQLRAIAIRFLIVSIRDRKITLHIFSDKIGKNDLGGRLRSLKMAQVDRPHSTF